MRRLYLKFVIASFGLLLLQVMMLGLNAHFARTFDLLLIAVVLASVFTDTIFALTLALVGALIFDGLSVSSSALASLTYVPVAVALRFFVNPSLYRFDSVVFSAFVFALMWKVLVSVLVAHIGESIPLVLLPKLNYFGIMAYLIVAFVLSRPASKLREEGAEGY